MRIADKWSRLRVSVNVACARRFVMAIEIDTTVPVSARIWNYWLGGTDYYPVDKEAGDLFAQLYPNIFDEARASRHFIARVVRYLAGEAGIRQFLDIGTGLPSHDNTHEIAQRVAPDSRIVYVDNDPLVLAHARALLSKAQAKAQAKARGKARGKAR